MDEEPTVEKLFVVVTVQRWCRKLKDAKGPAGEQCNVEYN
jgi:hypothetical protein